MEGGLLTILSLVLSWRGMYILGQGGTVPTLFVWGLIINYQVAIVERGEEQHTIENMHVVNERVNNNAFSLILTVSSCTVGCRRRSCTFRYTLGSWECCEGGEVAKKCAWYLDCRHTYIDREGMFGEVSNILWGVLVLLYNLLPISIGIS